MTTPIRVTVTQQAAQVIRQKAVGPQGPSGDGAGATFAADFASLPLIGTTNVLYVTQDEGKFYQWTGAAYEQVIPSDYNGVKYITSPTLPVSPAEGDTFWNASDHCLDTYTGLGGVVVQNGQELLLLVYVPANAAEDLEDGWPISLDGSSGQRPIGYRTDVTSETSCRCFMGLSTMAIPKGTHGFVNMKGLVRGLDTSAFNEGDRLWATNAAPYLTNVEPTSGQRVLAGMVLTKSAQGLVFSSPRHFELTAEMKAALKADGSIETPGITYANTYFKDQIISLVGINPVGPAAAPVVDPNGEGWLFAGASTDNVAVLGIQINHDSIQGATTIHPHVHWRKTTAAAGNVTWRLEVKSAAVGGDFGAYAQVGTDVSTPIVVTVDNNTTTRHLITAFDAVPLTVGLSTMLVFKLTRVASNTVTDTYAGDALAMSFDFHYEVDSPGSAAEYSKT
jgi:hypothetical protein